MAEAVDVLNRMIDMLARGEELFAQGHVADARRELEQLRVLTHNSTRICAPAYELLGLTESEQADHDPVADALSDELQTARIDQFERLSTCRRVSGMPERVQPVLLLGDGRISFGESVRFGWRRSPGFYDRHAYLEATHPDTHIEIGDNTFFNNGVALRAEGAGITIGADCLFGWSVEIIDSDFHDLHPRRRTTGTPVTKPVTIGDNVFVGAHTTVMKGVTIGADTVVGASSVVLHSLPAGVIAGGNPARVIRELEAE
jgi:acetyltransferase-like isoleucine patch superfamily enzyme